MTRVLSETAMSECLGSTLTQDNDHQSIRTILECIYRRDDDVLVVHAYSILADKANVFAC